MQKLPPFDPSAADAPCPFDHLVANFSPKSLSSNDKKWLGTQLYYGKISSLALGKKYGLPDRMLRKYKEKIANGETFQEKSGRPPLLDVNSEANILSRCSNKQEQKTRTEFSNIFQTEVIETARRRGEECTLYCKSSSRSRDRYLKKIGLMMKESEPAAAAASPTVASNNIESRQVQEKNPAAVQAKTVKKPNKTGEKNQRASDTPERGTKRQRQSIQTISPMQHHEARKTPPAAQEDPLPFQLSDVAETVSI
jgi:transposase